MAARSVGPVAVGTVGTSVAADVTDPTSLARAMDGVDVVVHAASYVGPDANRVRAVNAGGTANVVRAARHAGVRRIVYLSTAAVYGHRTARNAGVEDLEPQPSSRVSRSRLVAENAVLEAGGVVARPYLVHGQGDRWFAPAVATLFERVGGLVAGPDPMLSIVEVGALGRALIGMALAPERTLPPATVWHVNHPDPTPLSAVVAHMLPGTQWRRVTLDEALDVLRDDPAGRHQLSMVSGDRWYDSRPLWRLLDIEPGPAWCTAGDDDVCRHRDPARIERPQRGGPRPTAEPGSTAELSS